MRKNLFPASLMAMALALFAAGAAFGQDNIKVLILEQGFEGLPKAGETLTLLKRTEGELIAGGTSFRGALEVWRGERGLYLINDLPIEQYVEGVVSAETGDNWELEALKAQAVAVRTYISYQLLVGGNKYYDVTSSVLHQVFKGRNADSLVSIAVLRTRGETLTYDGSPIAAYYHSTCGGETEDAFEVFGQSLPYLRPVKSSCSLSPYNVWSRRIPLEEIEKATGTKKIKNIEVSRLTDTGRAAELRITANPAVVTVGAQSFRKTLGWKRLPSTDFTVLIDGEFAVIDGRGYGHGVGMCQWGSLEMARGGLGYRDILAHFYPGTTLTSHAP